MTIKRPMKAPAPAPVAEEVPPAAGGATIADRFKLDMPTEESKPKASGGKSAVVAVIAAVLALAVAGVLTFILFQHWEYMKAA